MTHFKIGQTVYYYYGSESIGYMVTCEIKQATKDLATGKITYVVSTGENYSWFSDRKLTDDYLYASKKQLLKEHKDEIAYGALKAKLDTIENALDKIMLEYAEKMQVNPVSWATISANDFKTALYVEGIGNVQEEFDKLKKEVADLKKKIKKPTKKTVTKKTSADKETPDDARNEK